MTGLSRIVFVALLLTLTSTNKPKDYDSKLWCNTCEAIVRELVMELGESRSEMYID